MTGGQGDWPPGIGRRVLRETDSTMAEAARAARSGLMQPEWVLALHQSAGKGRRGRPWIMPEGNFAASLVMRPDGPPEAAALRSFVAALALREALIAVGVAPADLALKWPNDVLLRGGKLAGILLESLADGRGGIAHLVIGIGVNLAVAPPPEAVEPGALTPVSLAETCGIDVSPEAFLDALAPAFARFEAQFVTYGFAPIRTAWLAQATRLGQGITARLPNETLTGIFRDLDGSGNLILDTDAGRRKLAAAEISF